MRILFFLFLIISISLPAMENQIPTQITTPQGVYIENTTQDYDMELGYFEKDEQKLGEQEGTKDYGFVRAGKLFFIPREDIEEKNKYWCIMYEKITYYLCPNPTGYVNLVPGFYYEFNNLGNGLERKIPSLTKKCLFVIAHNKEKLPYTPESLTEDAIEKIQDTFARFGIKRIEKGKKRHIVI